MLLMKANRYKGAINNTHIIAHYVIFVNSSISETGHSSIVEQNRFAIISAYDNRSLLLASLGIPTPAFFISPQN